MEEKFKLVKADREILEYMKTHKFVTPKELVFVLGLNQQYVWNRLSILKKAGYVKQVATGLYTLARSEEAKD